MKCKQCGASIEQATKGPKPLYCGNACRVAAHRARVRKDDEAAAALQRKHTYACPCCTLPAHVSQMHKPTKRQLAQLERRARLWAAAQKDDG